MKPMINIITLGTSNLVRATEFYANGLWFPKMNFDGDIAFFALQGTWLAIYPWELLAQDARVPSSGSGFRGVTLAHNVKSQEQVLKTLAEAEKAGAKIIKQGQKTEWGGFSGYFADLDDHLWEVAFNPFFWPGPKDAEHE